MSQTADVLTSNSVMATLNFVASTDRHSAVPELLFKEPGLGPGKPSIGARTLLFFD